MSNSSYIDPLRDIMSPFLEAASQAKQYGNISFKRLHLDVPRLTSFLQEEIDEMISQVLVLDKSKNKTAEMRKVVEGINSILAEFKF